MSLGIFQLVKNEALWIGPWLKNLLPYVDEFVLYDGNSTDGTLEIIDYCKRYDPEGKIRLFLDKDPKNLQEDYVRLFDSAMRRLTTDWAAFIHPDMHIINPSRLNEIKFSDGVAQFCHLRSFAGDPEGLWFEIKGRAEKWKQIFRLRRPDLGAHYHGHYGAGNEGIYFRAITGDSHEFHGEYFDKYPYAVEDSGLKILHFSDVRKKERRLDRMKKCLENQGHKNDIAKIAENHPRVSLRSGSGLEFIPGTGKDFNEYLSLREEFEKFLKVEVT